MIAATLALLAALTFNPAPADQADDTANTIAGTPAAMMLLTTERAKINAIHASASDQALLRLNATVCLSYDSGMGFTAIVSTMMASGWQPTEAGVVVGGAVSAICPQHLQQMRAEIAVINGNQS